MCCNLVDCKWTSWVESECSATCGSSATKTKIRRKAINEAHGGVSCPGDAKLVVPCKVDECPGRLNYWTYEENSIVKFQGKLLHCAVCTSHDSYSRLWVGWMDGWPLFKVLWAWHQNKDKKKESECVAQWKRLPGRGFDWIGMQYTEMPRY